MDEYWANRCNSNRIDSKTKKAKTAYFDSVRGGSSAPHLFRFVLFSTVFFLVTVCCCCNCYFALFSLSIHPSIHPMFESGDVEFLVRTQNVLNIPFYGSFTLCVPLLHIYALPLSAIIIFSVCCPFIRPLPFTICCQHNFYRALLFLSR